MISSSRLNSIQLLFTAFIMALATTGVQGNAAKAKPARNHEPIPRIRNGNRGRLSQTWSARGGAFNAARSILCLRRLARQSWDPSRNGEGGKTQIGKALGDDEGPPQADRDGTRAGMPAGPAPLRAKEGRRSAAAGAVRKAKQARPGRVIPGGTPPRALSGGVG